MGIEFTLPAVGLPTRFKMFKYRVSNCAFWFIKQNYKTWAISQIKRKICTLIQQIDIVNYLVVRLYRWIWVKYLIKTVIEEPSWSEIRFLTLCPFLCGWFLKLLILFPPAWLACFPRNSVQIRYLE